MSTNQATNSDDCDDTDAAINPAAKDVCNFIDDDCDRFIDEDIGPLQIWFDDDGDGYGDPTRSSFLACAVSTNQATNSDDCDDDDGTVHPGATDVCNLGDDDCDGLVDEDDLPDKVWPDLDGDGHGDGAYTASVACTVPSGYAASDDDCDDSDATVSPSATESCNGVDDDCDGSTDEGATCSTGVCGSISTDTTWTSGDTIQVTCDVEVTSGAVLTIEDGVTVLFDAGAQLQVGLTSTGTLTVAGSTTTGGVTFTSSATSPAAGDWDGLAFGTGDGGSSISGATISYGGGSAPCLEVDDAWVYLQDSTVSDCDGTAAVSVLAGDLQLYGVDIVDNAGVGVDFAAGATSAYWYDVDLSGNGDLPVRGDLAAISSVASDTTDSSYLGNGDDTIAVRGGSFDGGAWLTDLGVPYRLESSLAVSGGAVDPAALSLDPGVELQVAPGAGITVAASGMAYLQVVGTPSDPVRITSSAAVPAAGDWLGITIGAQDQASYLNNFVLEYGGGNGLGNLVFDSTSGWGASVDTGTVRHSAAWGIYRASTGTTTPTISSMTYTANASGDVF